MSEIILYVVLAIVIIGFLIVIAVLNQRLKSLQSSSAVELMKSDVIELSRTVTQLSKDMSDSMHRSNQSVQQSVQKQLSETAKLVADVT